MPDEIDTVAEWLRHARAVVVLTGAGISAESRIPTFRDTMQSLWQEFDPEKVATPQAFEAEPEMVSRWYDERRLKCLEAEPNPGHTALATIEGVLGSRGGSFTLLTQNVDGLHRQAGNENVVELHGSLFAWRGVRSGRASRVPDGPFDEYPPRFEDGEPIRPGVVWFGEILPQHAIERAYAALASCDLFMSVGTSAVVHPAAGFVHLARENGARTAEVNPEPTPITGAVDASLRGKSGEVLPKLVSAAFGAANS